MPSSDLSRRTDFASADRIVAIRSTVAARYGITIRELDSRRRAHAPARLIAYWLARELTQASYPVIAAAFANRDHTTVMHGVSRVANSRPMLAEARRLRETLA